MFTDKLRFAAAASVIGLATAFTPAADAEAGGRHDGGHHYRGGHGHGNHGGGFRDRRPIAPNSIHDHGVPRDHGHPPHRGYGPRGGHHGHGDWDGNRRDDRHIHMDDAWRRAQRPDYGYGYPSVVVPRPVYPSGIHGNVCVRTPHATICLGM